MDDRFDDELEVELEEDVFEQEEEELLGKESDLFCKFCGKKITNYKFAIDVNGKFKHICVNPHGILFEIGCFSKAYNCNGIGQSTYEFTWFPGYAWKILVCSGCLSHLGWQYSGPDIFYGLILQNLTEEKK